MSRLAAALCTTCVAFLALCAALPAWATDSGALTADQIIAKNVAARGGLTAWRKVKTMVWLGHIQSARAPTGNMRFALEMKRPDKTHFEIRASGQAATRIFDGAHGWEVRLTASGRPAVQPYSAEELRTAKDAGGLDGPLMDYQAKGIKVSLEGMGEVEGRKAYRLHLRLPSGSAYEVWVDAKTFLELKYDRQVRTPFGQLGTVSVYYRDYRTVGGVKLPFTLETMAAGLGFARTGAGSASGKARASDKMIIDKVVLNPPLTDIVFARPAMFGRRNAVSVDTRLRPMQQFARPGFPMLSGHAPTGHGAGR